SQSAFRTDDRLNRRRRANAVSDLRAGPASLPQKADADGSRLIAFAERMYEVAPGQPDPRDLAWPGADPTPLRSKVRRPREPARERSTRRRARAPFRPEPRRGPRNHVERRPAARPPDRTFRSVERGD